MTLDASPKAGLVVDPEALNPGCQELIATADRTFRKDVALTNQVLTALREGTPLATEAEERIGNVAEGLLIATRNCMELDFTPPVEPYFRAEDHRKYIAEFRGSRNADQHNTLERRLGLSLLVCYTRSLLAEEQEEQAAATQNNPSVA